MRRRWSPASHAAYCFRGRRRVTVKTRPRAFRLSRGFAGLVVYSFCERLSISRLSKLTMSAVAGGRKTNRRPVAAESRLRHFHRQARAGRAGLKKSHPKASRRKDGRSAPLVPPGVVGSPSHGGGAIGYRTIPVPAAGSGALVAWNNKQALANVTYSRVTVDATHATACTTFSYNSQKYQLNTTPTFVVSSPEIAFALVHPPYARPLHLPVRLA